MPISEEAFGGDARRLSRLRLSRMLAMRFNNNAHFVSRSLIACCRHQLPLKLGSPASAASTPAHAFYPLFCPPAPGDDKSTPKIAGHRANICRANADFTPARCSAGKHAIISTPRV